MDQPGLSVAHGALDLHPLLSAYAAPAPPGPSAAAAAPGPFSVSAVVAEDGSALIDVLGPEPGAGLTLTAVGPASDGTTALRDGQVLYTPFPGFIGPDTFVFDVQDAAGDAGVGVAGVSVVAGAAPPATSPVSAVAAQGVRTSVDVLAGDSGSGLLLTSVSAPAHGTAALDDGKIDYTSNASYLGPDSFTYAVKDADGAVADGEVDVTVQPVSPPSAVDQTATAAENGSVLVDALAGDSGTGLTLTGAGAPADGTATIQNGQILYTPAPGFVGLDSFAYTVTGATGLTASAEVDVAVEAAAGGAPAGPTNLRPTVFSPALTVVEGAAATPIGIALPTDPAADVSALIVTVGALPTDGTVTLAGGGAIAAGETIGASDLAGLLFTPAPGVFGARSSLTYTVTDPLGNAASGAAELVVGPAQGAPSVSQPSLDVAAGATPSILGIAAPSDPNFSASELSVVVVSLPADGTVTSGGTALVGTGQALSPDELAGLRFTPASAGASAFGYRVTDPAGNTSEASVAITVAPAPPVPLPAPDAAGVVHTSLTSLDLAGLLRAGDALDPQGASAVRLADGTPSFGAGTDAAFVERLYDGLLGRAADPQGLEGWTSDLAHGATRAQVAAGVLGSAEYLAASDGMDARAFAASLYQGFLGRAPDAAGLANWLAAVQPVGRAEVAALFADAPEAEAHDAAATSGLFARDPAGTAVEELYQTALGREADPAGLARWTAAAAAQPLASVAAGILGAPEAVAEHAGQTGARFAADLYLHALGRQPTAAELAGALAELSSGANRADLLLQVATGAAAQAHLTSDDLRPPPAAAPPAAGAAPPLSASGPAAAVQGAAASVTLASAAATSWTVSWGDGGAPQTVAGADFSPTHVYAAPGGYVVRAVADTPDGAFAAPAVPIAVSADTFQATSLTGLTTGFHVRFDAPLNAATAFAAPDSATGAGPTVIVTDPTGAVVPGSVALDADGAGLTFTATVGALPNGTYRTVLLGAIQDAAGRALDGAGVGTPGDDFSGSFVVSPADAV